MVSRAITRPPMAAWIAILNNWRGISSLSLAQIDRPRASAALRWAMKLSASTGSWLTRMLMRTRSLSS